MLINAEKNMIVGNTCNAKITPNLSELTKSPNKNEVPALVKSNNLVIKLLAASNAFLPGGNFNIKRANANYIVIPIPTSLKSIFFLLSDIK